MPWSRRFSPSRGRGSSSIWGRRAGGGGHGGPVSRPDVLLRAGKRRFFRRLSLPYTREERLGDKRFFFTHSHLYDAKLGLYQLVCAARERKADLLLFGHTHQPLTDYDDGLYILNPGSLSGSGGTYGTVDITPAGVVLNIVRNRA